MHKNYWKISAGGDSAQEIFLHALFLALFIFSARWLIQAPLNNNSIMPLLLGISADLAWLAIIFLAVLAINSAGCYFPKAAQFISRLLVFSIYVLVITQVRFENETGLFYSASLAHYALTHWRDLSLVLISTGLNIQFALSATAASCCYMLPIIGQRPLPTAQVAPTIGILIFIPAIFITYMQATPSQSSIFQAFSELNQTPLLRLTDLKKYPYSTPKVKRSNDAQQPNILVVVIESARASMTPDFSGTGPKADMSNLQQIMAQGRRYDSAYTTTSHTSKALIGILCGVHPYPTMEIKESQPNGLRFPCLPRLLESIGYKTLFIQSATEHFESRRSLMRNIGFNTFLAKEQIAGNHQESGYFGLDERAILKPFKSWWEKQEHQPRLAVMLTSMTHHPYQVLGKVAPTNLSDARIGYLTNLKYTDQFLGELRDWLSARGDLKNTVIVITGDHGEGFSEHQTSQHDAVPYEEGIRVPLVLSIPNDKLVNYKDQALRQHIDLLPTLLTLAGGHLTSGRLPGKSLLETSGHDNILTSCWWANSCITLVSQKYKSIYFPSRQRLEHYELGTDPQEKKNIYSQLNTENQNYLIVKILRHRAAVLNFYQ